MTIEQDDLMRARLSPRYRTGIWLGRLGNVLGLPLVAWAFIDPPPPRVFLIGWSITMALITPAVWLASTALPGVRRGWLPTIDPAVVGVVWRDTFRPKPKG